MASTIFVRILKFQVVLPFILFLLLGGLKERAIIFFQTKFSPASKSLFCVFVSFVKESVTAFFVGGDICSLPKKPGLCMAYIPRWFYNTAKGKCERFIYGGCLKNANNFITKNKCDETCSGNTYIVT